MHACELRERLHQTDPGTEAGARRFVNFDESLLDQSGLMPEAREFLTTVGLPSLGGANMMFHAYTGEELDKLRRKLPEGFYPIGQTYVEDIIAIEAHSGMIRLFESSLFKDSIRVNQSVNSLAEALCIYEECGAKARCHCLERIAVNDPESAKEGSYWFPFALGHMQENPETSREKSILRAATLLVYGSGFAVLLSLAFSNGCFSSEQSFNAERWQASPGFLESASSRKTMATDLIQSKILIGLKNQDIIGLLGDEDERIKKDGNVRLHYKLAPLSFAIDEAPDTLYLCVEFEAGLVKRVHSFEGYASPER